MAQEKVKLSPGFLIREGHNDDLKRSEDYELPVRIAEAVNLFSDMGILREGRAFLYFSTSGRTSRTSSYYIALPEDDQRENLLFSMFTYAEQAIVLKSNDRKFSVEQFADFLLAQAKSAYYEGGLTKSKLGVYSILRILFTKDKLSDEDALELGKLDVPLKNIVPLWKEGATLDVIRDTASIPDSWLKKLLGR